MMDRPIATSYLLADPVWFENPAELAGRTSALRLAREPISDWHRSTHGIWTELTPTGGTLPEQGWKVHLSCTPSNHEYVVEKAWQVCSAMRITWKFIPHTAILNAQNDKASHRGGSGKAVTVYPDGEDQLRSVIERLEALLADCAGPYILSDLRWKELPIFLRYGSFVRLVCLDDKGTEVAALRNPSGEKVPDRRRASFDLPDWVRMPEWLREGTGFDPERVPNRHIDGYTVVKPLHFSNSGGVYLAEDENGHDIVLKEARPHTGIDAAGQDAVDRLRNEYETLRHLDDVPWAPQAHRFFQVWEHSFLAMEHVQGTSLQQFVVDGYPLIHPDPSTQERQDYLDEALPHLEQLESIVEDLHEIGLYFGDLHIKNVLIKPDGSLTLIDFEAAGRIDAPNDLAMGAPGYMTTASDDPVEKDWFAFAASQIAVLAPFNTLFHLNPGAITDAIDVIEEQFDCASAMVERMRNRLGIGIGQTRRSPDATPNELLRTALKCARTDRGDLLYPADPTALEAGGSLGLASGASGVMFALLANGHTPPDDHVEWLATSAERARTGTPTGLYDGLGGAAFVLHRLAHPSATGLLDKIMEDNTSLSSSLQSGTVGIAHLCFEAGRANDAVRLAEKVAASLEDPQAFSAPGALFGRSGAALLFARCHTLTGDASWVRAGLAALEAEAPHAETNRHGSALGLRQRTGLYPYLGNGSAGYGMALLAWEDHLTEALSAHLRLALNGARTRVVLDGSLLHGRSGLTYFLAQSSRAHPEYHFLAQNSSHLQNIHYAHSAQGPAGIGRFGLRLSTDLATGSAGMALTEMTLSEPQTCELPGFEFTTPVTPDRTVGATGTVSMKFNERI
ncbi:class III lanthionine synthetase LanKC [Haloglycomyces albus]|uniref:class III lanthionine synthetase LanKC n=1 Tax=Haloglycomyces albus TaxID=526067 RepID=UPI00046D115F|nr:class III lanthionine synthetase LanKC [Haloglycomyces albus]